MHAHADLSAPLLFDLRSIVLIGCDIAASTTTATKMEDGGRAWRSGSSGSGTWTQRVELHCIAGHSGGRVPTELRS